MSTGTLASAVSTDKPKKLLDRVRDALRVKHYSLRTERSYCDWIERFIRFHRKRHPSEMGEAEVSGFLTHLAREGQVAASTRLRRCFGVAGKLSEVLRSARWFIPAGGFVLRPAAIEPRRNWRRAR